MNTNSEQIQNPIWQAPGAPVRFFQVCLHIIKQTSVFVCRRVPGLARLVDRPGRQPLRSMHGALLRWSRAPYGTQEKPDSLAQIPWDYVRENEDKIPFYGLREYWYPALRSAELPNNKPAPLTMLNDNVVFFRGPEGEPLALENRCPHRSALLSLGQVGVWEPGTLTCRYHGLTFDGQGTCLAVLTEGPDSPARGKLNARAYPVEEAGGIIWIYMGEKPPRPLPESVPHLAEALGATGELFIMRKEWPVNYLATLDNDTDLAHPGCIHRTCFPFMDQKMWGQVGVEETGDGGIRSYFKDSTPHPGRMNVESTLWYLPNIAYFGPGMIGSQPNDHTFVWAVPRGLGNLAYWIIIATPTPKNPLLRWSFMKIMKVFSGDRLTWPGSPVSCVDGADASMIQSQGRIARWDRDRLLSIDCATVRARIKLKKAHQAEIAEREAK